MSLLVWLYPAFIVTAVTDIYLLVARDRSTGTSRRYSLANRSIANLAALLLITAGIVVLNAVQGAWWMVALYSLAFGCNTFFVYSYYVSYDNWLKRQLNADGSSSNKLP